MFNNETKLGERPMNDTLLIRWGVFVGPLTQVVQRTFPTDLLPSRLKGGIGFSPEQFVKEWKLRIRQQLGLENSHVLQLGTIQGHESKTTSYSSWIGG